MSDYLLNAAWQREQERLESIQALHGPITIRHLETLGVDQGWRCAEVGAGAGSIAQWHAQRTGPQAQQAVRQHQQATQHAVQQVVLGQQQVVRQRAARQPTTTVAGCVRTLVGVVVMVVLVSVFFVLLLTHPF